MMSESEASRRNPGFEAMSEEQFKKSSSNELPQTEPDICETHTSNRPSRVESCSPTGSVPMKKPRSDRLSSPVVPPSPPKTVSLDQLAQAAKDFYRMSLAHEITMDADFKLESSTKPEEGLRQKVKETMHAAFWDLQRQKLEADPPDYSSALELLKEIKSSLVDMILPYQSSLRAQINDKLDMATAEAQLAETGRFDLASYTTPIIDIMATWCAPARDADVARLHDITDSVDFLKRVFEILEQMHMDLANFTIEKMRPYIRQHAAVYEREKFDQCLEAQKKAGVDGLARTRQWLQEAFEKLCESAKNSPALSSPCRPSAPSSSAPVGVGGPATSAVSHPTSPPPPTPNNILREAYLALLTWDSENEFPETMLVDASRIQDLSDCLTRTVTLASVILTVCNTVAHNYIVCLSPGQTSLPAGSMTRLKETVSNDVRGLFDSTSASKLPNLIDLVTARVLAIVGHWRHRLCTAASTSLEDADHQWAALPHCDLPEELQDQLVKQVTAVLNGEHPVYNLMFSRALDFLRSALSARPPDPLTLPSGFGALSESGGPTGVPKAVPSCDRLIAGGALQKTPLSATGAPEGDAHTDLGRTYDLTIIASRLMPLVAHNRHVFGPHYAEIIQGLLLQGQNGGDAVVAPT